MRGKISTYHIIGGGISGLSAARFIKEKNINNKVILYESAAKLGGRCYSFFDPKLDRIIDNATHVILGANTEVLKLMSEPLFSGGAKFFDSRNISRKFWNHREHLYLSIFNTAAEDIAPSLIRSLIWKLFPFWPHRLKICFSKGDLSAKLIEPLSRYIDEINLGCRLQGFETNKETINKLKFNKFDVEIGNNDRIITALDAANYAKIFNEPEFDFNEISNIFFRTSTALTLPGGNKFLATPQNTFDWIFINDDIAAVTISNSQKLEIDEDELARIVWQEIRALNGLKPAFLPPYRVMRYKQATIKQDEKNNNQRPKSAVTKYKNLKIAGDWTMKGWPCCLEAAVLSAKRAVK